MDMEEAIEAAEKDKIVIFYRKEEYEIFLERSSRFAPNFEWRCRKCHKDFRGVYFTAFEIVGCEPVFADDNPKKEARIIKSRRVRRKVATILRERDEENLLSPFSENGLCQECQDVAEKLAEELMSRGDPAEE